MGVRNLIKLAILFFLVSFSSYGQELTKDVLKKKVDYYNEKLNSKVFDDSIDKELQQIYAIADKKNYDNIMNMVAPMLSQLYFKKGEIDKSFQYANKYLEVAQRSSHTYNMALAYSLLFNLSNHQGDFPDAIKKALISEAYFDKAKNDSVNGEIVLLVNFQYFLNKINDYRRAQDKLKKASLKFEKYKGKDSVFLNALIVEAEGLEFFRNKDYDKAREKFQSCLISSNQFGFKQGIASSYNNIGVIDFELGNYEESLENLHKSYDVITTCPGQYNLAETCYYLAKNYIYMKNYDRANHYLDIAIKSGSAYGNADFFCKSNFEKLKLLFSEKDELGAEKLLNNIIENELFLDYQDKDEFFLLLLNHYTKNDNKYKEIVRQYQEAFREFKKKLREKNLDKLEYVYDYQQTRDSLELNKAKINSVIVESKKKAERTYWLIIMLAIISITIIIIFYNRARVYKLKNQKNLIKAKLFEERKSHNEKIIDYRNRKLIDFAIHVNEKNKILNKIKDQLKVLSPDDNVRKGEVYNLIGFITNTINQSEDQVQIFKDADKLNEQFLANLSTKYPELNKQERRVVTFIRLGLNSKQIATQMNISYNTVENYRYKVRKKMNLSRDISLKKFVNTI